MTIYDQLMVDDAACWLADFWQGITSPLGFEDIVAEGTHPEGWLGLGATDLTSCQTAAGCEKMSA